MRPSRVGLGWAGSGHSTQAGRDIRTALDVDIDDRGLTPAGELRHPVVRTWRAA
jgi:bifunctional non-homologous end joining protein LigD